MSLVSEVRNLLARAVDAYAGTAGEASVRAMQSRMDEPLRVALAGKVKAGKSTLLNALVGEELAPTGAQETTRIVTWYVHGPTYRVTLHERDGDARQVRFTKEGGAVEVDLGSTPHDAVERLVVEWPTPSLRAMTLIDTPGLASLSTDVSQRTVAFLTPGDDQVTPADAVLYLLRHLHATDINFLEAFHDEEAAQATPTNAVGVLSRADELAVGRLDAMASAQRIAERYRSEPKVRRLCQTVVPVAGLLAVTGSTLREGEFAFLRTLAGADQADLDALLLTVDRFANAPTPIPLTDMERGHLLGRLGLFGVRLSVALIRQGAAQNASHLATELVARSGLVQLNEVLTTQFASRRDLLKARSALVALESLLGQQPVDGAATLAAELERITASTHELAEMRLLTELRAGGLQLKPEEAEAMERLLGAVGDTPAARLGLEPDCRSDEARHALEQALSRWQRRAESPLSTRAVVDACRVVIRTCEGLLARPSWSAPDGEAQAGAR